MGGVAKVVGKIAGVVAVVTRFIPGLQVVSMVASAVAIGASLAAGKPKAPKTSPEASDRLIASIDPRAPRKVALGRTALATDIRDQEFTGNQEYLHRFIVVASHKISAVTQLWFDDKLAWTSTGGVQGEYAGYLTVAIRTEGSAANAINISTRMGSSRRFTGCAYVHLRYKLTGNSKKAESPFAQSIATRLTVRGDGAFVYDPRLDSTAGGSGACRANNQSTWIWSADASRNPALQLLWYFLGWRIDGKLAVGKGIPPERIDMASFITAANLCDEPVTRSASGTEPRYRSDGVFSEGDSPTLVMDNLKAAMNADLDDVDGKIRLTVFHNDLGSPVSDFTEDDILGAVQWRQTTALESSFNVVRGSYTDPSDASLYQMVEYPEIGIASPDGIERVDSFDLALVQSPSQAQRLAKQRLQRSLYGGMFMATFQATAWRVQKNDVLRLSFRPLGFINKLFRVVDHQTNVDGTVPMTLREESASIYAWDAEESPAVVAADPTVYDFSKNPIIEAIDTPGIYYDDTPPTDPGDGRGWVRPSDKRLFIFQGQPLQHGGEDVTHGGEQILTSGWVDAQDVDLTEAITLATQADAQANAAIDLLDDLGDDGVLTPAEKIQTLIPEDARLEGAYNALVLAATTVGVSTTAATAARAAWQSYRNALYPLWNDVESSTSVSRATYRANLVGYDTALEDLNKAISEQASDTSVAVVPAVISDTIEAQSNGTIKADELPWEIAVKLVRGADIDVTSAANWSVTLLTGSATIAIGASTGVLTVSAIATPITFEVSANYGGIIRKATGSLLIEKDTAAVGGGGSPPGPTASDSTFTGATSTSYSDISDELTVVAGASGKIDFTAPLTFKRSNIGVSGAAIKVQWRALAGSYADVSPGEVNSSSNAVTDFEDVYVRSPGSVTLNHSKTGLTPGTSYNVKLRGRAVSPSPALSGGSVSFQGTFTATGG